jgi:hypothetical protein
MRTQQYRGVLWTTLWMIGVAVVALALYLGERPLLPLPFSQ